MSSRPNVLWIMADQHNAKCTGWGDFSTPVHTPNLERLAAEGTRFDRARCQNPICTPSRTSYLTGQYAMNHGYFGLSSWARADVPTLFGLARDSGYRTGVFGKIHTPDGLIEPDLDVVGDPSGHNEYLRGRGLLEDKDSGQLPEWAEKAGSGAIQAWDARPSDLDFEDHAEYWAAERTKDFIDGGEDPFCAWLSFSRPHQVWTPAAEFWEQYPDEWDLDLPPSVDEDADQAGKPPIHETPDLDEESEYAVFDPSTHEGLLRRKLRGYLGCVTEVDALVGEMLDFLERRGLREDTIVIYCADHGDFATEHGLPEKAPGISYDAITRVPFVWSWPGHIEEGNVDTGLVETIDMLPTLAGLIDGWDAPAADGTDITDRLTGDAEGSREYAITENPWARSVRTERYNLTVYPRGFFGDGADEFLEFYDLEADPWETENLAETDYESYADEIDRLRGYLYEHVVTNNRPYTTHPAIGEPCGDGTADPDEIRSFLAEDRGNKDYL